MTTADQQNPVLEPRPRFGKLELTVIVVVIIALVAIAAERLARAHDRVLAARIETLAGTLQTAVSGFQANWKVQDQATIDVPGWADGSLDANSVGYPVGGRRDAGTVARDQDCADIWRGLLVDAPPVAEAEPNSERGRTFHHIETKLGTDVEFVAGQDDVIPDATVALPETPDAEICQFISLHHQSVQPGAPKPTIFYDSRTGTVFTDLHRVF